MVSDSCLSSQEGIIPLILNEANFYLLSGLWLYTHPLWRCGRCGRSKEHVPDWYIPAECLHPRLRSVKDGHSAYRISSPGWNSYFFLTISFCLPSAVSLITALFPAGRRRNLAFGIMGGGQHLGFAIGLVAGGAFTDTVGWQGGLYLATGINSVLLLLAFFGLPKLRRQTLLTFARFKHEIDWVGALILSTSLALLLYVFA